MQAKRVMLRQRQEVFELLLLHAGTGQSLRKELHRSRTLSSTSTSTDLLHVSGLGCPSRRFETGLQDTCFRRPYFHHAASILASAVSVDDEVL